MPLYPYQCKKCGVGSEILVRGSEKPACPECGSTRLEKMLSHVAPMSSDSSCASASPSECTGCCAEAGGSCPIQNG